MSSAVVQPLSVTQNGIYNSPSGVDGYAPVAVNVTGIVAYALPSEYQQVAYIRSSGTQYIKTGVVPTVNTSVKIEIGDASGMTGIFCGTRSDSSGNSARFMPARGHDNMCILTSFGFSETPVGNALHTNYNTSCIIEANLPGQIVRNIFWSYQFSEDVSRLEFINPIALFGCGDDNNTVTYLSTCSIGKCTIKDNITGITLRDFVPCYRKADDEIGMYDLVNGIFYTNQGTGTFTKGPDVLMYPEQSLRYQYTGASAPSASLGRDGDIYKQVIPLPTNVNFVEYLESTGTQYINTGIYNDELTDVKAKITKKGSYLSFGARSSYNNGYHNSLYQGFGNSNAATFLKTGNTYINPTQFDTTVSSTIGLAVESESGYSANTYWAVLKQTGTIKSTTLQAGTSDYPQILFGINHAGSVTYGQVIIFRITYYQDKVPIADYLPCLDPNGVACMWDNIAQEYVYNDGTGDFLYGNTVTPTQLEDVYYLKANGTWTVNVSGGQTEPTLYFDFLQFTIGTPIWSSSHYSIERSTNRIGANISTINFKAGDIIDIGDFETYKLAIGTNDASTSAPWINGGYITSPYALLQADLSDMKCLMIARVDNANMTNDDIQYIQQHACIKRS